MTPAFSRSCPSCCCSSSPWAWGRPSWWSPARSCPGCCKPDNPQRAKLTPYECGAPPLQEGARHRYSVKFYLVAMLFILFDVEAAFLLPWAVQYQAHLWTFWAMLSFLATLLVGYVYAWGKGALDWER